MQKLTLLCLCACALMLSTPRVSAQEEATCIKIERLYAKCLELGPDGRWRYQINLHISDFHPEGDALYISSNSGRVGTPLFLLPPASNEITFRYVPVTSTDKACFSFTVYEITDDGRRRLCRIEKCIELPKCQVKCDDVSKRLKNELTVFEGEDALLHGMLSLAPAGVQWFRISVSGSKHITWCSNTDKAEWKNLKADVTRANLSGATDPQINNEGVRWNFDSCFRMTNREFKVLIDLPPICPQTSNVPVKCIDTAEICIRYQFKLCDGPACDTTVCFRLIRRCSNVGSINPTIGRSAFSPNTALDELTNNLGESINVAPNPAADAINISFVTYSNLSNALIDVVDVNGNIVATHSASVENGNATLTMSTSSLPNGLYAIVVRNTPGVTSTRFVVSR